MTEARLILFTILIIYVKDIVSQSCQSPIDLNSDICKACPHHVPFIHHSNYWNGATAIVQNSGETVRVTLKNDRPLPTMKGGPLSGTYVFSNAHFHWGKNNDEGSEHSLNQHKFAMEAHFVHYNEKYGSVAESLKHEDGIAVVGLFIDAAPETNTKRSGTQHFSYLTQNLKNISTVNSTMELAAQDILSWFHERAKPSQYFTYHGSLTTPGYNEAVIWIVYPKPVHIPIDELKEFRSIATENFRAVQPINNRDLYYCGPDVSKYCKIIRHFDLQDLCYFFPELLCKTTC